MAKEEPKKEAVIERTQRLLDDVIGIISPHSAIVRKRARFALDQLRKYEGASKGRRLGGWVTPTSGPNDSIGNAVPTLRARSRDLIRNNPHAAKALNVIVNNTIGTGIVPQAVDKDKGLVRAVEDLWKAWGEETICDADGAFDFYGIERMELRSTGEGGGGLVRKRSRRLSDKLPVPLQLQALEADFLDTTKAAKGNNGNTIVQGVEFDRLGRIVAYWLFQEHPGDYTTFSKAQQSQRVPADQIIHMFRRERLGQVTGVPWAAPVIVRAKDLDDYEDAQLMRQKVAACFAGYIKDMEALEDGTDTDDDDLARMEPGSLVTLGRNKDIVFNNPPGAEGYADYTRAVLRAIAAGFGITYESLTTDYSQVNFSSARMGWLEFDRQIQVWRNEIIIPTLCKPVWKWFMEAAINAGHIPREVQCTWTAPRREMINPVDETKAAIDQVRSGFKSRSEIIREMGYDAIAVEQEIADENKRADALKLVLDSDPRHSKVSNPA
jgi:lambda family phage portal protein